MGLIHFFSLLDIAEAVESALLVNAYEEIAIFVIKKLQQGGVNSIDNSIIATVAHTIFPILVHSASALGTHSWKSRTM